MKKIFFFIAFPLVVMTQVGCNGTGNSSKQDTDSDTIISDVCNDTVDLTFDAEAVEKEVRKELGSIKPTDGIFLLKLTQNYTAMPETDYDGEFDSWDFKKGQLLSNGGSISFYRSDDGGGWDIEDYTGTKKYFLPYEVIDEVQYETASIPSGILDKATLVFKSNEGETVRLFKAKPQGHKITLNGDKMSGDIYMFYHGECGNLLSLGHRENDVQLLETYFSGKIDNEGNLKSDVEAFDCDDMSTAYYIPSEKSLLYNDVLYKLIDIVQYDDTAMLKFNSKKKTALSGSAKDDNLRKLQPYIGTWTHSSHVRDNDGVHLAMCILIIKNDGSGSMQIIDKGIDGLAKNVISNKRFDDAMVYGDELWLCKNGGTGNQTPKLLLRSGRIKSGDDSFFFNKK